jgi:hypothetical protein
MEFYKQLKCFLKDLNYVFPEDDALKIITSSILIFSMDDDSSELVQNFYGSLGPLENMIYTSDSRFFYMDHSVYWGKTSHQYQLFTKLSDYWEQLDESNRKIIWDYIHVLYKLSKDFCTI